MEVEALLGGEQSFVWSAAAAAAGLRKRRGQSPGGGVACLEIVGWPRRQRPAPGLPVYLCGELAPRSACPSRC